VSRYQVEFSRQALTSLREAARYIADDAGLVRAAEWLRTVRASTVTLETYPRAFPRVGLYEGEEVHARFIMRRVLYYFVDEDARVVTIIDTVHTARQTEREAYEQG